MGTWIEIQRITRHDCCFLQVVPYVGTWIEMNMSQEAFGERLVVPYVGTWIEIYEEIAQGILDESFPTWERG